MSTIDRDSRLVAKLKRGASGSQLGREFKLKPLMVERIIRNWLNDIAHAAMNAQEGTIVNPGL